MVKFNYKTSRIIPDISSTEEEDRQDEPLNASAEPAPAPAPEIDTSFDSTDSFFEKSEPEGEASTEESFVVESEEPAPREEEMSEDLSYEEESSFKETLSEKRKYIVGGAVILSLLIIFFVITLFTGGEEKEIATVKQTEQKGEAQPAEKAATPPPVSALNRYFAANQSANNYLNRQFSKIASIQSKSAQISMINISSGRLSMTILGDNRDEIVKFHMELKKAFPTFNLQLISVGRKVDGLSEKMYGDILGEFSLPPAPAGGGTPAGESKTINFEKDFKGLVKSAKLQLKEFKAGKIIRKPDHVETVYYASLKGGKQQILSLFNRLASAYPAVKINKFTLFAENLGAINGEPLAANINLTYFTE